MKGLIFVYLLSYGGSAAALFSPFIGLCIYYCYVVLRPQDLWFYSLPQGASYSRYVALATLIGWSLQGFSGREGLRVASPVLFTFAGFVLVVQISAWFALNSFLAEPIASDLLKMFLMFLAGLCLVTSRSRLQALIWVFILSQGYLTHEMNLTYFLEGINIVVMGDGFGPMNNNGFALSLLPGIGLAFMTAIYERRWWLRVGALYAAVSTLHVILLSESRGGYLGVFAMVCVAAVLIPKNGKTVSTFLLIVVLGMTLAGESVRKEFATIFADKLDDSAASRPRVWRAAYQTMMDYPLLGVGPGNFAVVSADYGVEEGRAAHNLYLQVGADCGITGLTLLLLLYLRSLKAFSSLIHWRLKKMTAMDPVIANAATGAFTGLVGYMIHSVFSSHVAIETPYLAMLIGGAALRLYYAHPLEPVMQEHSALPIRRYAVL
jgi:O-antigen ligase